jgi:preprotein translocase subunit SecD
MAAAPRVIGIIVCAIIAIASLAFLAPAAVGLVQTSKGKGTRIGLAFADQKSASLEESKQTIIVLGSRMSRLGVSNVKVEPSQTQGEAIQVLLPPGTDVERAKPLLTNLGLLELKLVAKGTSMPYATKEEAQTAMRELGTIDRYEVALYRPREEGRGATTEGWVVLEKTPVITSADVSEAKAGRSQFSESYEIDFQLKPDSAMRFGDFTGKHIGDYLAIVINNEVRSAPTINSQITDRAIITGSFTQQSAEDLALMLNTGSLPRPLVIVSEQAVDASSWASGFITRIAISLATLVAALAFLFKLARSRPAPPEAYWPQTYGQSGY